MSILIIPLVNRGKRGYIIYLLYKSNMTVQFNEEKQKRRLDDIRKKEEEGLVKFLAGDKYHIPYIDLGGVLIENEALPYLT